MNWREHMGMDPDRMHGLPCFRGTRVPVHIVLDNLAAGETAATILAEYPSLRPEHLPAMATITVDHACRITSLVQTDSA